MDTECNLSVTYKEFSLNILDLYLPDEFSIGEIDTDECFKLFNPENEKLYIDEFI